jgi:3-oxoisoapionate kinase
MDRIIVVSGSCSPVTAAQIERAEAAGFEAVAVDPRDPDWQAAGDAALAALARGRSPIVATARGTSDPDVIGGERIGAGLGHLLDRLVREAGVSRAVIAGGDTSIAAARSLDLVALTAENAVAPGAALMRGHRADGSSIELALKGGRMGPPDFFVRIRDGMGAEGGVAAA